MMIQILNFILSKRKTKLGASGFYPIPRWLRFFLNRYHVMKRVAIYAQLVKGADMSLLAPDEYGCEESVTRLLRMVDPNLTPVFTFTLDGLRYMNKHNRFIEIDKSIIKDGVVVIAATGTWKGKTPKDPNILNGHTGIFVGGHVYSNNSYTGMWDNVWNLNHFIEYYQLRGGMKVRFFAII